MIFLYLFRKISDLKFFFVYQKFKLLTNFIFSE
jgi:hypothetical protein